MSEELRIDILKPITRATDEIYNHLSHLGASKNGIKEEEKYKLAG